MYVHTLPEDTTPLSASLSLGATGNKDPAVVAGQAVRWQALCRSRFVVQKARKGRKGPLFGATEKDNSTEFAEFAVGRLEEHSHSSENTMLPQPCDLRGFTAASCPPVPEQSPRSSTACTAGAEL